MKIGINIKCTFSVELSELDLPDTLAEKLLSFNDGEPIENDSDLGQWLNDNIHIDDAYEWEYDITNAYIEEGGKE